MAQSKTYRYTGNAFIPDINLVTLSGSVVEAVQQLRLKDDIHLVVVGTHDKDRLSNLLIGNKVNKLINHIDLPLLIVLTNVPIQQINRIVFATALDTIGLDKQTLMQLLDIARPLEAEVLLTHIYHEKKDTLTYQRWTKEYLEEVATWAN